MATAEIKIKSSFNSSGVDAAKRSLQGLDRQGKEAVHNLTSGFNNLKTGNITQGISLISSGLSGLTAAASKLFPIAGGIAAIGSAVASCVKEFGKAEVENVRFSNTLKSLGLEQYSQQFNNFASKIQSISGVGDEVVKSVMNIGLQMGVSGKDIERFTKLAFDMSAAFGIDAKKAMEMLVKAQEGEVGQLTRMLPFLKDNIKEGMKFADVIGVIENRTKGASEAMGNTLQGSMSKLKESFGDLKENIGSVFVPAVKDVVDLITKVVKGISTLTEKAFKLNQTEIDKQISQKQSQIDLLKQQSFGAPEDLKEVYAKQIEQLKIEIAILKQQKVAQEQQYKLSENNNSTTTEITETKKTEETKKEEPQQQQQQTQQLYSSIYLEHYKQMLEQQTEIYEMNEEEWKFYKEQLEEELYMQQLQEYKQKVNDEMAYKRGQEQIEQTERINKWNDFISGFKNTFSNAFGVNLQSGVSGFILSLVQGTQSFQALSNTFKPLIKMLDAIFKPILQALAPVLQIIFQTLAPVIKMLLPPLIMTAVMFANLVIALKSLGEIIYYIISFQWDKLKGYKANFIGMDTMTNMMQTAMEEIDTAAAVNPYSEVSTGTSTTSYSASGARDIYVNIYFQNSYVNGDAREIALRLRDEIRLAESMGY